MKNKFKVWCKINKEWEKDLCVLTPDGDLLHRVGNVWVPLRKEIHIPIFGTGLRDNTRTEEYPEGKEICKGDIIDASYINPMSREIIKKYYSIEYEEGQYKAKLIGSSPYGDTWLYFINQKGKVIGNIYENPELLEE